MQGPEYDVQFRTNSIGMRDEEVGPKQDFRILLLGDSYASGYGVERHQTFVNLLEQGLQVEILNASVGGWDIINQVFYFRNIGSRFDSDLVVYAMFLGNDLTGNDREIGAKGLTTDPTKTPIMRRRSLLLPWVPDGRIRRILRQFKRAVELRDAARHKEWEPTPGYLAMCQRTLDTVGQAYYVESREHLGNLVTEVRSTGTPIAVVMFGYRTTVEPEAYQKFQDKPTDFDEVYDLDRPAAEISKHLSALGVYFLNLNPILSEVASGSSEPLYYPYDGHSTPRGHEVVAEATVPFLRRLTRMRMLLGRAPSSERRVHETIVFRQSDSRQKRAIMDQ